MQWALPVCFAVDPPDLLDDELVQQIAAIIAYDPAPPALAVQLHLFADRPGLGVCCLIVDEVAVPTLDEQDTMLNRARRLLARRDNDRHVVLLPFLFGEDSEQMIASASRTYDSDHGWLAPPPPQQTPMPSGS